MDYLARESAPFSAELWDKIDGTVVDTARRYLVGRRFLTIFGPLGAGVQSIHIDEVTKTEDLADGVGRITGRRFVEIPQLYEDFTLLWRDLESSEANGYPVDLSAAMTAAQRSARKEDELIFFGNSTLGSEGLLTAEGVGKTNRSDWKVGENAFTDVAKAITMLAGKGILGRYALVLSPDLYLDLQRIQPALGMMELDRVQKLVNGKVFQANVLGSGKALLVCAEPQYMDLVVGQDLSVGYLELKDFNHSFRMLETIALRIKSKDAIIVFEA